MFKNLSLLFLIIIFAIGFLLRFSFLADFPLGFHVDEASLGYNAYSLLLTGKDDNNNPLPLYIDMFGDNRPSGYHFITIIPVALFGLSIFATRFPSALFGSLIVVVVYFLALEIFREERHGKKIALVSSLLSAVSPWGIVVSRASGEAIVALFFILTGALLFLRGIRQQHGVFISCAAVSFSLSFFFYHTPRVFVPLLFLALCSILYPVWKKYSTRFRSVLITSFVLLCFVSFALVFLISGGTGRYSQVNIFSFPETRLVLEEQLREDGEMKSGVLSSRIFHNKVVSYTLTFTKNYLEYFTGNFLLIQGGLPKWYLVPGMGLTYLVAFPFLFLGVLFLATSKKIVDKVPLVWLVVAPVVGAITVDDIPNVNRAIAMSPMIEIVTAAGFIFLIYKLPKRLLTPIVGFITLLFICNVAYFLHQYFVHAPIHRNWYRNVGVEQVISKAMASYDKYDNILITKNSGGIYPLVLFYTKFDPSVYQSGGSVKDTEYKGFGKFFFVPQACPATDRDNRFPTGKNIFIESGECKMVRNVPHQEYVTLEDGSRAYHIVYE